MLSTAIIIFREILEISMILGVVLAATRGLSGRGIWIGAGFGGGFLGAGLVAVFAGAISNAASGMGQEFFNAMILFTAATVIGWTALWMRTHARELAGRLRETGEKVTTGELPGFSLSLIIGLTMLREGSEIVLFIYSMALSGQSAGSIVAGSIIGLGAGTVAGMLLYLGLIKMSARYMLRVTGWLLVLLVAGLSSQGAGNLVAAGYFSGFSSQMWNTHWLLAQDGIAGKALHSLIGYSERPTQVEVAFYVVTLLSLLSIMNMMDRHQGKVAAVAVLLVSVCASLAPRSAFALDEIYSPNVEYRELSVEYNGSHTFDNDPAKNNAQEHELAVEYGISPRWEVEASAGFERDPQGTSQLNDFEIENRFQFFEQGEMWMDSGMLVAYDHAVHAGDADTLEVKLLLQKDIGRYTSTANIGFEQEVGVNAAGGPDYVFLWNTRYRYSEYFEPGIEIQSDLGSDNELQHWNEQQHYIGPAVYGRIFGNLKYQAGYFAGVGEGSASSAGRILFEYEMHI